MKTVVILICMLTAGAAIAGDTAPSPPDCQTRGTTCYALYASSPGYVGLRIASGPMDLDKCREMESTPDSKAVNYDSAHHAHYYPWVGKCEPMPADHTESGIKDDAPAWVDITPPDLRRFERPDTVSPAFSKPFMGNKP